jgi:hypothetical protein
MMGRHMTSRGLNLTLQSSCCREILWEKPSC